jgi:hypothetical protein
MEPMADFRLELHGRAVAPLAAWEGHQATVLAEAGAVMEVSQLKAIANILQKIRFAEPATCMHRGACHTLRAGREQTLTCALVSLCWTWRMTGGGGGSWTGNPGNAAAGGTSGAAGVSTLYAQGGAAGASGRGVGGGNLVGGAGGYILLSWVESPACSRL